MNRSYEWLTVKQHALKRPDTYAGGTTPQETVSFAFDVDDAGALTRRDVNVVASPSLFKVIDEAIQNAMDNKHRDPTQKAIWMRFADTGVFEVSNDGRSIPLTLWGDTGRYTVEMSSTDQLRVKQANLVF